MLIGLEEFIEELGTVGTSFRLFQQAGLLASHRERRPFIQSEFKHGSVSTYSKYGCRCEECKAAKSKNWRQYYAENERVRTRGRGR